MKWIKENFTAPGLVCIGLLLGGTILFLWFVWAIETAVASGDIPTRAVSRYAHRLCDDLPRGSQILENERKECFDGLYRGRVRIN